MSLSEKHANKSGNNLSIIFAPHFTVTFNTKHAD